MIITLDFASLFVGLVLGVCIGLIIACLCQ